MGVIGNEFRNFKPWSNDKVEYHSPNFHTNMRMLSSDNLNVHQPLYNSVSQTEGCTPLRGHEKPTTWKKWHVDPKRFATPDLVDQGNGLVAVGDSSAGVTKDPSCGGSDALQICRTTKNHPVGVVGNFIVWNVKLLFKRYRPRHLTLPRKPCCHSHEHVDGEFELYS
ncbi:hypothetical protein TNCV_615661 [Trichonephila clavipes]|nr:hypothetical protein TNCV_615661 [Trichonephila clavipes]